MKVTRTRVTVAASEIRYREVCAGIILAIGLAIEVIAIVRHAPWAFWLVLALIVTSACVQFHVRVRVTFPRLARWRETRRARRIAFTDKDDDHDH